MIIILSAGDATDINLAICDGELNNNVTYRWGELYIHSLERKRYNFNYFDSIEEAIDSVKSGQNHAAIDINERFTKALRLRFLYLGDTDEETLEESQIYVHIDRSNQLLSRQIEAFLNKGIMDFIIKVANSSNMNPGSIKTPLVFEEPVYGNLQDSLREYISPGSYLLLTFFGTYDD